MALRASTTAGAALSGSGAGGASQQRGVGVVARLAAEQCEEDFAFAPAVCVAVAVALLERLEVVVGHGGFLLISSHPGSKDPRGGDNF